jgi:hypothetical protein
VPMSEFFLCFASLGVHGMGCWPSDWSFCSFMRAFRDGPSTLHCILPSEESKEKGRKSHFDASALD